MTYRVFRQPPEGESEPVQGYGDPLGSIVRWPDGRHIAANGMGRVFLWERDTGRCARVLESNAICRDGEPDFRLTIDPVLGRLAEGDKIRDFALWDTATWERLQVFTGHGEAVRAAAFIGDDRLVSVSGDSTAILWDAWSGARLRTVDTMPLYALADDPRSGRLATAGASGQVYVSDRTTLDTLASFRITPVQARHAPLSKAQRDRIGIVWDRPSPTIRAMAWHPDGEHLVCGSWDFVPKMIDARTGRCVRAWQGHAHWVDALAIDAEGRRLITGSSDHTVRVWDLDSEDCLAVFELGWPEISDVMLDQGEILAACRDEIVILPLPARS